MGLNYKILSYKNKVTQNNEEYLDLASKSFDNNLPKTGTFVIVNHMYIGRPDLISLALYGDDMYGDIICKINGISNPFELNENDLIFVPDKSYLLECCKVFDNDASDFITDEDDEILYNKMEKKAQTQKSKDERRAPYEQVKGETNYVIDRTLGIIFY